MDDQLKPMTEEERTAAMAFLVGYFYGTLTTVAASGQVGPAMEQEIKETLSFAKPIVERVYWELKRRQ